MEKSLVIMRSSDLTDTVNDHPDTSEGGVRLFKKAPVGIVFDYKGITMFIECELFVYL